jgi:hypothetical protein
LLSAVGVLRNAWGLVAKLIEKITMVGTAELSEFELMGPEQVVDSVWKRGDLMMHQVLEAGEGTERSSLGMRHLERARSAGIRDVSADTGNGVDEGYGGRVVYFYPATSRSNAAREARGSTRLPSMRSALLLDIAGHLDFAGLGTGEFEGGRKCDCEMRL